MSQKLAKQRPWKGNPIPNGVDPKIDVDKTAKEIMEMAGNAEDDAAEESLAQLEMRTFLRGTRHDAFMQWLISPNQWKRISKNGAKITLLELKAALAEFHKGEKVGAKKEATPSQLNVGRMAAEEDSRLAEEKDGRAGADKEESKRVLRRSPRVGRQQEGGDSSTSLGTEKTDLGMALQNMMQKPREVKQAPKTEASILSELFEGHTKKRVEYTFMMGIEETSTGCIQLEEQDTVGSLKQRIQENQGILADRQLMSMGAVQLDDKDVPMGAKCKLFLTNYTSLAAEKLCKIKSAEKRGITVDQLDKLREFIKGHRTKDRTFFGWCDGELSSEDYGKPLRYSSFDIYQLIHWVLNPFTKYSGVSYIEMVAQDANAQEPQWFLACHFAEPIIGLISCVDAHAKVRALPETTSYWVCVFSCSQRELDHARRDHLDYMTEQPFYRALKHCKGLLFVADSSDKSFSRIWCCFELSLHLCFKSKRRLLDIATDYKNKSYVITDGLTEQEQKKVITMEPIAGWSKKTKREIDFPMWALTQALDVDVAAGNATDPKDKKAILDFLAKEWDGGLSMEQLNLKIRTTFAHMCWRGALVTNLRDLAIREKLVKLIAIETPARKSVSFFMCGIATFGHEHMCELVNTLPPGLEKVTLDCTGCTLLTDHSLSTFFGALPKTVTSLEASFCGIENISDVGILHVSENLPAQLTKFRLRVRMCWKISNDGISNLTKALEQSKIKELDLNFRGCTKIRDACVKQFLFGLPPTLTSLQLDFVNTGISEELLGNMAKLEDVKLYKERVIQAEKDAQDAADAAAAAAKKARDEANLATDLERLEVLMKKFNRDPQGMAVQEKTELARLLKLQKELQKEERRRALRKSPRKGATSRPEDEPEDSDEPENQLFFEHRRATVHGNQMKHPVGSPHSTMSFWKTPSPKATDDDIQLFFRWCAGRAQTIHDLFRQYDASGRYCSFRNITAREFVEFILWHGFEGNALRVFEEIQLETTGLSRHVAVAGGGEFGEISLPQLQRFERRHSDLGRGAETPVVRFVKKLRKSRGSLLRAWRLDLDLRGSGLVAHADFVRACRQLGFSTEVKELWNSLRPGQGSAPLEFREFDGPEAMNLDRFAEALWNSVDFDLNKAWCCLDPRNRGVLTLQEFKDGAKLLGFEGNAALLFKGLDTSGLGKLKRHELLYLQVLTQSAAKTDYVAPPIRALGKWVHSVLGSPSTLISKLGLTDSDNVSMSPDDFTTQLIRFGYRGDAKRAALLISQFGRNDRINSAMLYSLLADTAGHTSSPTVKPSRTCKTTPRVSVSKTPIPKKEWQGTITDVSHFNIQSAPGAKVYFSTPVGGDKTLLHPDNLLHRPGRTMNDLGYTYVTHVDEESTSTIRDPQDDEEEEYIEDEGKEEQYPSYWPLTLTEEAIKMHENIPEFRPPPRLVVNTTDATRTASSPQLDFPGQYMSRTH